MESSLCNKLGVGKHKAMARIVIAHMEVHFRQDLLIFVLEYPTLQDEYKQVLSEVNFHMSYHNARHGFVLTNAEFSSRRLTATSSALVSTKPWRAL
jgi:hypothetical protein